MAIPVMAPPLSSPDYKILGVTKWIRKKKKMSEFEKEGKIEAWGGGRDGGWLPASIQVWKQIEFDHLKYVSSGIMHRGVAEMERAPISL